MEMADTQLVLYQELEPLTYQTFVNYREVIQRQQSQISSMAKIVGTFSYELGDLRQQIKMLQEQNRILKEVIGNAK